MSLQKAYTATLKIDNRLISHLIGKDGWRIEKIKGETKTKITIGKVKDNNGDVDVVLLANKLEKLELAKTQINKFVNEYGMGQPERRTNAAVPELSVSKLLKAGNSLKKKDKPDVSVSVTLNEGDKPVEIKAGYRNGKLCCLGCETTLGKHNLRDRLINHAKKCVKMDDPVNPAPKPKVVSEHKKDVGLGWTCDRCFKQFTSPKLLDHHLKGKGVMCANASQNASQNQECTINKSF